MVLLMYIITLGIILVILGHPGDLGVVGGLPLVGVIVGGFGVYHIKLLLGYMGGCIWMSYNILVAYVCYIMFLCVSSIWL